jgi:hypothetical protein
MLNYKKAKKTTKFLPLRFNKEQKEGLARVSDALATASIIGTIIGWTGHNTISTSEICILFGASVLLLMFSLKLRSAK